MNKASEESQKRVPELRFKGFTDDWEQRSIGDIYEFKNGINKSKEYFGKGTPIVNFTDVFHKRGLKVKYLKGLITVNEKELNNYKVKKGDLFFSRTSEKIEEIGMPSVMLDEPKNTIFSGFLLRGRAIQIDHLENNFKQYVFITNSFRKEMIRKSSMTTRALTTGKALKEMKFNYPEDTLEQKKIGNFLNSIDDLITLYQRKLEKLEELKNAFLQQLFPAEGESVPNLRFLNFNDDWKQHELREVATIRRGLTYKPNNIASRGDGIRVLRSSNIINNKLQFNQDDIFVEEISVNKPLIKHNDILVTSANGSMNLVGKHALVKTKTMKMIHGGFMLLISSNISEFIQLTMSTNNYKRFIVQNVTGGNGAIGNLSARNLEKFKFRKPPSSYELDILCKLFNQVETLIFQYQERLNNITCIKRELLNKMFI